MLTIATRKYGCNPNLKTVIKKLFVVYVEDYWPTSIIFHNRLPLFRSSPTSCSSIINRLVHHSKLFYTLKKSKLQFCKSTIWVTSHIIVLVIKHNIFEGKTKQINNFYILCFTICSNGSFKNSNMSIWVKILHILKIVK